MPSTKPISQEQNEAEEKLCQWAKELYLMGVDRKTIHEQVDYTLDECPPRTMPYPEDECPNCQNGTVGLEGASLVCRGECGHDWGRVARVTFIPQVWVNDYAQQADPEGPTVFYVPEKLVANMRPYSYESDELREHENCPVWAKEWSGPFECDFDFLG